MNVLAAVMTGPGAGAIATIQVFGVAAEAVLREVFQRKGDEPFEPRTGRILLGSIVEDGETVDEVTIGCEGPHAFAIHCHGNPLIVERIIRLLQHQGAQPVPPEQLLLLMMAAREPCDSIGTEAKLALTTVKTVEGAALITHQMKAGLARKAQQWRDSLPTMTVEQIAAEAGQILRDSEPARLIISGCTIALVGPPNTGKSTLLNTLAGREKAIVTDLPGTTRDWVSAEIHIPPLAATLIDTAGFDSVLSAAADSIDQAAQRKSTEILARADLVLLVLDRSRPAGQIAPDLVNRLSGRRTIVVLNKSDLPAQFDLACLPVQLSQRVPISAKQGAGIDDLIRTVHQVCHVASFPSDCLVAFTDRQRHLLERLLCARSKTEVASTVSELLHGPWATQPRFSGVDDVPSSDFSETNVMTNNFVAHLDILGFASAVLRDFDEAWGALSDLESAMDKALRTVPVPIKTGVPLVDKVRSVFFSDSIILYTAGESDDDLIAILIQAATLFAQSLRKCVPLRGGIGHGRFCIDAQKSMFMGESLIRAHRIGEDAQWLGIVLDSKTADRARQSVLAKYAVAWDIPGKNGKGIPCTVLNWMKPYKDAGSLKKQPITLAEFYQPFERLFGPYAILPPEVRRKYENTVAFMNADLSG